MTQLQKLREAHDYKQANGSMNCMQCAAAYMLGFPVEMVPDFALHADATLAWDAFHAFFKAHGYAALMLPSTHAPESDYLASGSTSRGTKHIVVMNDGELVFDPHPSNAGLSKIDCIYVIARQALALPTAAPVGERGLPPVIAYRLDYPASEGVGLPRFFGADDGERAHTFAFNHKATITELCDRAALSAGDAVDAQQSTPIACAVHVAGRTFEKGVPFCNVIDYIESNTTRWVASSDRHPPEGERVFFMDLATNIVGFDMWAGEGFTWMPSHWMPIPPAPAMRKDKP